MYVSKDRHLLLTRQSYRGICRKSFIRTFVVMCVCMCVRVCVCVCVFVHSGASGVYPHGSSGAEDILTGTYVTLFTNHSLSPSHHTHTLVLYELPIPRGILTNLFEILSNSISVQKASLGLVLSAVVTE